MNACAQSIPATRNAEELVRGDDSTMRSEVKGIRNLICPIHQPIHRFAAIIAVFLVSSVLYAQQSFAQQSSAPATYTLKPTPKTVAWGYYDAKAAPVLRVKSGDIVEIQTLLTNSPKRLEDAGVPPDQVEQSLRDITAQVTDKGPGGHILTGPIYIEGADIGDVLEVKILSIKLAIPYAYNAFGPGRGYLPDDYPYAKIKIIPLDAQRMVVGQIAT